MNSIKSALLLIGLLGCSFEGKNEKTLILTDSGLSYEILKPGSGSIAKAGLEVTIKETTKYRDGTLIFSTEQIGGSLTFLLGGNQVVDGVDEGVQGMQIGEVRRLIVPPTLSKRSEYPDYLSPDSVLIYEIELLEILE